MAMPIYKLIVLTYMTLCCIWHAGVQEFIMQHPAVVDESLDSAVESTSCRKDLGEKGKLRHWSRGHVFVVRSCGHVDTWKPIFR